MRPPLDKGKTLKKKSTLGGDMTYELSSASKTVAPFCPKPVIVMPRELYVSGGNSGQGNEVQPASSSKLTTIAVSGGGTSCAAALRTSAASIRTLTKRGLVIGRPPNEMNASSVRCRRLAAGQPRDCRR